MRQVIGVYAPVALVAMAAFFIALIALIMLVALALLTADLGSLWTESLILSAANTTGGHTPIQQEAISIVAPVIAMAAALLYALRVMRPEPRAATPAAAWRRLASTVAG